MCPIETLILGTPSTIKIRWWQKEFTQAGVELLGINSPEADAEIIATAIGCKSVQGNFR